LASGCNVLLFSEYSVEKHLEILRIIKMILIHDLVEIDAGDIFCYDEIGFWIRTSGVKGRQKAIWAIT